MKSQYDTAQHDQLFSEVISSSLGQLPEEQKYSLCYCRTRENKENQVWSLTAPESHSVGSFMIK